MMDGFGGMGLAAFILMLLMLLGVAAALRPRMTRRGVSSTDASHDGPRPAAVRGRRHG